MDANVSLHKEGTEFGVRTEIKNISSIRSVAAAINYEINRQRRLLEGGGIVVNETRSYDAEKKATIVIRDKEEKQDYRFMPEPNLPPLRLLVDDQVGEFDDKTHLLDARNITVPELPQDIRNYLINKLGLSEARTLSLMVGINNLSNLKVLHLSFAVTCNFRTTKSYYRLSTMLWRRVQQEMEIS